jgi:hypothetical protein
MMVGCGSNWFVVGCSVIHFIIIFGLRIITNVPKDGLVSELVWKIANNPSQPVSGPKFDPGPPEYEV